MSTAADKPLRLEGFVTSGLEPIAAARLTIPLRMAATRPGVSSHLHVDTMTFDASVDGRNAVFLRYRPQGQPSSWPLHRALLQAGYLIVADVDDLLWEGGDTVGRPEANVRAYQDSDFVAYRGVHALQVSTAVLADEIRRFNPTVRVFPAAVADIPAFGPRPERPPRLGFAAINRRIDWQPIMAPLNRVLRRRPDILAVTIHDAEFHAALETPNKQLLRFQPYQRYLETLAEFDIALLPLADNRFNRAKSDLKFVEFASRGTAVLASATVYGDSIEDGVTGLLYRTPEEFEDRLQRLLADRGLRSSLAQAAHRWVVRHRRLEDGVDQRLAWYRQLLADKPRLDAGIRERAAWILDPDGRPGGTRC